MRRFVKAAIIIGIGIVALPGQGNAQVTTLVCKGPLTNLTIDVDYGNSTARILDGAADFLTGRSFRANITDRDIVIFLGRFWGSEKRWRIDRRTGSYYYFEDSQWKFNPSDRTVCDGAGTNKF